MTPEHLRLVLQGKRRSEKLAAAYRELVNAGKREPATAEEWRALAAEITPEMRAEAAERAAMPKEHGFFHPGDTIQLGKFFGLFPDHAFVEEQIRPYCREEEDRRLVCERAFVLVSMMFPAIGKQVFIATPKPAHIQTRR